MIRFTLARNVNRTIRVWSCFVILVKLTKLLWFDHRVPFSLSSIFFFHLQNIYIFFFLIEYGIIAISLRGFRLQLSNNRRITTTCNREIFETRRLRRSVRSGRRMRGTAQFPESARLPNQPSRWYSVTRRAALQPDVVFSVVIVFSSLSPTSPPPFSLLSIFITFPRIGSHWYSASSDLHAVTCENSCNHEGDAFAAGCKMIGAVC